MNKLKPFSTGLGLLPNKFKIISPRNEKRRINLFIFGYFLVLFFPALRYSKPWSDDWALYWDTRSNSAEIINATVSNGRPVLGWLLRSAYSSSFFSNNLIALQLVSIVGIYLLGLAIYSKMRASQFGLSTSLILVLGVGLLPGFQEYVYFISCFAYSWACLLGFLSFTLVASKRLHLRFLGVCFLTLSFLIYPTGAMFYFLAFYIEYLASLSESMSLARFIKKIQINMYGFIISILISLSCAILISKILGIDSASRVQLVDTFALAQSKFEWILTRLFVFEFRIFSTVSPTPTQAILEFCLIFIPFSLALLAPWRELNRKKFFQCTLILLLPLLGALPNLVISENQFEYRTLTAAHSMALLMWLISVGKLLDLISNLKPRRVIRPLVSKKFIILLATTLILSLFGQAQIDSKRLWITPSLKRDAITDKTIDNAPVLPPPAVCLVIPPGVYTPLTRMGVYSLKSDLISEWVPDPYIRITLGAKSIDFLGKVEVVKSVNKCQQGYLVIDYSELAD